MNKKPNYYNKKVKRNNKKLKMIEYKDSFKKKKKEKFFN
jgi:hypothetical protein